MIQNLHNVVESDFGANDFLIDFLKRWGFWDIITGMLVKMGKNNGYLSKIILGILIIKELMAIRKIAGAGKIIKDGKPLTDIGFNIEKIEEAEKEEKGAIDLCTLRNHLKKIPQIESSKAFYEHLKILRNKRWIIVKNNGKKEKKKIRICGINGLSLRRYSKEGKEKDLSKVNAVIVYDKHKGKMRRRIYVTTLDAEKDPLKVYKLYKDRWTIENQGIRYLSGRCELKRFSRKKFKFYSSEDLYYSYPL